MDPDSFVNLGKEDPKAAEKLLVRNIYDQVYRSERGDA